MKIQFVRQGYLMCEDLMDIIAEFDVVKPPTPEEIAAINDDIEAALDAWEEEFDDFCDFDYRKTVYDACVKHIELVENPIVHTFYI